LRISDSPDLHGTTSDNLSEPVIRIEEAAIQQDSLLQIAWTINGINKIADRRRGRKPRHQFVRASITPESDCDPVRGASTGNHFAQPITDLRNLDSLFMTHKEHAATQSNQRLGISGEIRETSPVKSIADALGTKTLFSNHQLQQCHTQ
jgi:hypothetical protein